MFRQHLQVIDRLVQNFGNRDRVQCTLNSTGVSAGQVQQLIRQSAQSLSFTDDNLQRLLVFSGRPDAQQGEVGFCPQATGEWTPDGSSGADKSYRNRQSGRGGSAVSAANVRGRGRAGAPLRRT